MKKQLSLHNKSPSLYIQSQKFSLEKNSNLKTLNPNQLKPTQLIQNTSTQLQTQHKMISSIKHSSQIPTQDFYFITSPTTLKAKTPTLKRVSIFKKKDPKKTEKEERQFDELGFHGKNRIQGNQKIEAKEQNNFLYPGSKQSIASRQNSIRKGLVNFGLSSTASIVPKGQITLESKWQKIIQLYTLRDELSQKYHLPSAAQLRKKYPILPSGQFYQILAKSRVFERQWKINFPETIFLDSDGNTVMIYTQEKTGILKKKFIEKEGKEMDKYKGEVLKFKQDFVQKLHQTNKIRLFKDLRIEQNPHAPLSIMKYTQDNAFQFETDVQSYRNFMQRNLKPTRDSIMQRYIYSNNLKAMVFRLYYKRHVPGESTSGPEFQGVKFQNQKPMFKDAGSNNFPETHKLTSTITLSDKRIGTIRVSPINNPRTLEKYTLIGREVQKMLQFTEKVIIDKLYIDFIVDVFDEPWVINIKYCEVNPHSLVQNIFRQDHTNNVSSCRLCGIIQKKQNLKNSVSVRMLCEFIHHLKKRTKQEDLHRIDFIQNLNINSKQNKASSVCKICYKVIIHEIELIKMQKKLAQICNVIPPKGRDFFQQEQKGLKNLNSMGQYKQWRLMLYFEDIKNMQNNFGQTNPRFSQKNSFYHERNDICKDQSQKAQSHFFVKYELCPKISQSFICKKKSGSDKTLKINQVKLHYFYSQNTNIEQFINNTEIVVSLYSAEESLQNTNGKEASKPFKNQPRQNGKEYHNEKLIARGSTHILSSFNLYKTSSFPLRALMENGQKQTTTVLLFFQNKKYCELTLKVGLVYDGSYSLSNIPSKIKGKSEFSSFIKWNEVWFSKNLWNSNPLPRQWMDIFGSMYNYDETLHVRGNQQPKEENDEEMLRKMLESSDIEFLDQQD